MQVFLVDTGGRWVKVLYSLFLRLYDCKICHGNSSKRRLNLTFLHNHINCNSYLSTVMVIYLKCIAAMERQIRYTEKYFVENKCNRQEKSGVRAENA